MRTIRRTTLGLGALLAALVGVVVAAALANVTLYDNPFKNRSQVQEIRKSGGGPSCARNFAKQNPRLRMIVREAATCRFTPPVTADGPRGNQIFRADGLIPRSWRNQARETSFLILRARSGGGSGYVFRVEPRTRKWSLRKLPAEGAGTELASGTDPVNIKGIGEVNRLRIVTRGDRVQVSVNGERLRNVTDPNPAEVTGTRLEFGGGHADGSADRLVGFFNRVRVGVPNPRP